MHVSQHLQPPGRHDAGGQVGGAGPQQKPAGDEQRLAQGRRGATSSEWEAIVLTQPAVLCPRTALAVVSAQSISQQPLC